MALLYICKISNWFNRRLLDSPFTLLWYRISCSLWKILLYACQRIKMKVNNVLVLIWIQFDLKNAIKGTPRVPDHTLRTSGLEENSADLRINAIFTTFWVCNPEQITSLLFSFSRQLLEDNDSYPVGLL